MRSNGKTKESFAEVSPAAQMFLLRKRAQKSHISSGVLEEISVMLHIVLGFAELVTMGLIHQYLPNLFLKFVLEKGPEKKSMSDS